MRQCGCRRAPRESSTSLSIAAFPTCRILTTPSGENSASALASTRHDLHEIAIFPKPRSPVSCYPLPHPTIGGAIYVRREVNWFDHGRASVLLAGNHPRAGGHVEPGLRRLVRRAAF